MVSPAFQRCFCVCLLLFALAISGCASRIGGSQSLEQVNDALRSENAVLEEKAKALDARNAELVAATKIPMNHGVDATFDASEVIQATPVVTSVEIDRLSGAKGDDVKSFTVYVRTLDGLQRFTQGVGRLVVELRSSTSDTPLQSRTLQPLQVRGAYRSGFAGTNYVVTFQLPDTQKPADIDLMRATFTDARTGQATSGELKMTK